jgi:hypothetical protein
MDLPFPDETMIGPERVHRLFREWLTHLGHPGYEGDGGPRGDARAALTPPAA